jgi:uncharacterized protein YhbP (UPF0306 family)
VVSRNARTKLNSSFRAILGRTSLCSIATVDSRGVPHINTAFFAYEGSYIYFLSDIRTKHCKNLVVRPNVAITVFDSHQSWTSEKAGIQLFGKAGRCRGRLALRAQNTYARRFPAYAMYVRSREYVPDLNFHFFAVRIDRFTILDEKRFGEEKYVSGAP